MLVKNNAVALQSIQKMNALLLHNFKHTKKNVMQTVTKKTNKTKKVINTKSSIELEVKQNLAAEQIKEGTTGKGLKKKIEQSQLTKAKIEANNDYKTKIHTIGFILSQIKESDKAKVYVSELATKYNCKITFAKLMATDKTDICKHITADEQKKRNANPERYTFWYVLTLISRHYKATK